MRGFGVKKYFQKNLVVCKLYVHLRTRKPNRMTTYKVVVTEKNGESYILPISAFNPEQAERLTAESLTDFYGEKFDGLVSAMI
jgi:CDP-diacylglycerol pyrophosphatase